MSRSRKKHPYIKDKGTFMRKVCSRAHRRISRQITHDYERMFRDAFVAIGWLYFNDDWPGEDPIEFPDRRSLVNPYDICDWYFVDHVKGYRK